MGLFGFGKKAKETPVRCSCGGMCLPSEIAAKKKQEEKCCPSYREAGESHGEATVKVLGSGCAKCNALEAATREALEALGMDTTIHHVTDFAEIAAYGVMTTPALVVDGKVLSFGKVLKKDEVIRLLEEARG